MCQHVEDLCRQTQLDHHLAPQVASCTNDGSLIVGCVPLEIPEAVPAKSCPAIWKQAVSREQLRSAPTQPLQQCSSDRLRWQLPSALLTACSGVNIGLVIVCFPNNTAKTKLISLTKSARAFDMQDAGLLQANGYRGVGDRSS